MKARVGPITAQVVKGTAQGRYNTLHLTLGPNRTPTQLARRLGESGHFKQFFELTPAQKQLWRDAAQMLTWSDLGGRPRNPSARALYNRLNRSRHRFLPETTPTYVPPLASLDVPPDVFTAPIDFSGASFYANAPYTPEGGSDPYPEQCVTEWEWVQVAYQPSGGSYTAVDPWQQTLHHPCDPTTGDETTLHTGTAFAPQTPAQMEAQGYFPLPAATQPPQPQFFWYRPTADNGYPNYDPISGACLLTVLRDPAMCIAVDVLWDQTAQSFSGPQQAWRYLCAIPTGVTAFRVPNGLLNPTFGGLDMPFIGAADPNAWGPFGPDNDIAVMLTQYGQNQNAGELIRLRLWPFTVDGWPGSVIETSAVYGSPLPYGPCPTCPPGAPRVARPCGCP